MVPALYNRGLQSAQGWAVSNARAARSATAHWADDLQTHGQAVADEAARDQDHGPPRYVEWIDDGNPVVPFVREIPRRDDAPFILGRKAG